MVVPELRWPMTPFTLASMSFWSHEGPLLRIRLIVLGQEFELDLGAPDFRPLALSSSMAWRAPFRYPAQVGLGTGHRRHMADLDRHFRLGAGAAGAAGAGAATWALPSGRRPPG